MTDAKSTDLGTSNVVDFEQWRRRREAPELPNQIEEVAEFIELDDGHYLLYNGPAMDAKAWGSIDEPAVDIDEYDVMDANGRRIGALLVQKRIDKEGAPAPLLWKRLDLNGKTVRQSPAASR